MVARHLVLGKVARSLGRTVECELFVLAAFRVDVGGLVLTCSAVRLLSVQEIAQPVTARAGAAEFFHTLLGLQL